MTKAKMGKAKDETPLLRVTLRRSLIGYPRDQRFTARGLGLGKINSSVVRRDCPEVRGMINKIIHLVSVEVIPQ
jgi:large subunit ribosomal protein L30